MAEVQQEVPASTEPEVPSVPSEPYLVNDELSEGVKGFLKEIFALWWDKGDKEELDKASLLSLMVLGYPDTPIATLVKSVNTMFQMESETGDELAFEQIFNINKRGASNQQAFSKMCKNLRAGWVQWKQTELFIKLLDEATNLPVIVDTLQLIITIRKMKKAGGGNGLALSELSMKGVVDKLREAKSVVVMAGAGISTSCGIPDFRSPGTGLYDNLQKYNLPTPQSIFELGYYNVRPEAFWTLSKEIFPDNFLPSPTHYFISLLAKKGILKRHYSQNIDGLERLAGVPEDLLVQAHGSFNTGRCLNATCQNKFDRRIVKEWISSHAETGVVPKCPACGGLVKPDIVFFGEGLPKRLTSTQREDLGECDLLLVMGTSLQVAPFCNLKDGVGDDCPRVLLNMEPAGEQGEVVDLLSDADAVFEKDLKAEWAAYKKVFHEKIAAHVGGGFVFPPQKEAYRDVFLQGKCDEKVFELCAELGWADELSELMNSTNEKLREKNQISS